MPDEYVDVIDRDDNELGMKKLKGVVHKTGEWHRGAHLWIVKGSKILLQKRSSQKIIFPNCFDVGCAGHVASGENFETTIIREANEELGLKLNRKDLIFVEKRNQVSRYNGLISREVAGVYIYHLKETVKNIRLQKEEVSEVRLFGIAELKKLLREKPEMFVEDRKYFLEMADKISELIHKKI